MNRTISLNKSTKASMFTFVGLIGALGVVVAIASDVILNNTDVAMLGKFLAFLSIAILMPSKNKDEFFVSQWNTGASWALIAVVLWTIIGPFLAGAYSGLMGHESSPHFPERAVFTVLAAGFFAGFHWRSLRGPA